MQYQSPIRLFEYCNIEITFDVSKIKKILAAEFSLVGNGIISIEGFDYSKNDILKELEREDFLSRWEFHILIWKEKSLLNCLEKSNVNILDTKNWFLLVIDNKQFIEFISPYFAEPFNRILKNYLSVSDLTHAAKWLEYFIFIDTIEDEEKALKSLRECIGNIIRVLKNTNKTNYKHNLPQIQPWIYQLSYRLIDQIPESLLEEKEELVRQLINFTVVIQFQDRKRCLQLSYRLVGIKNINNYLYNLIRENHNIYQSTSKSFFRRHWARILILIVFILRLISTFL